MDLRVLKYFVACVEHKTMHAAAAASNVSQPALSKAISNLEAGLGVQLLDRRPRGVVPTPYGDVLFRYAKMIAAELRRATAELDAMRGMTRGTVVVGVIPTMADIMGDVAQDVLARHPGLRLRIRVGFSAELTAALTAGEVDLALLLLPTDEGHPGLTFDPLLRARPVIVVGNEHPLADKVGVTLDDLRKYPWLIPDYPASHRAILNRSFLDAGIPPPEAAVSVSTVIFFDSLIAQSELITVAPATLLARRQNKPQLKALDIAFPFAEEEVGLAYRSDSTVLPGARAIIALVKAMCLTVENPLSGLETAT